MLVWRYADPSDEMRVLIDSTVKSFHREIEWFSDLSGKNWILEPYRLHAGFAAAPEGYIGVLGDFKVKDQGFCVAATREMESLISKLESMAQT